MLRNTTMVAALCASAALMACGGDDKQAQNPQQTQCPPGQYFDGQFCQNMQQQPAATAPAATTPRPPGRRRLRPFRSRLRPRARRLRPRTRRLPRLRRNSSDRSRSLRDARREARGQRGGRQLPDRSVPRGTRSR